MRLDYAQPPARPPNRELRNVALAAAVAAVACLGASVAMYVWLRPAARELQVAVALTSVFLDAIAIVTAGIAIILNPRGAREIAALTTAVAYILIAYAAVKYL